MKKTMKRTVFTGMALCISGLLSAQCPANPFFKSQAEIDSFPFYYPACTVITGDVSISEDFAHNGDIKNVDSLRQLTAIQGALYVYLNDSINDLSGFSSLKTIGGEMEFSFNPVLEDLSGLDSLVSTGSDVFITNNGKLNSVDGLGNLASIGGGLFIKSNNSLTDITALNSLTSVFGILDISYNNKLGSLSGIDNINPAGILNLLVQESDSLCECDVQSICDYLDVPLNDATIQNNKTGCNSRLEVENNCNVTNLPEAIDAASCEYRIITDPSGSFFTIEHTTGCKIIMYAADGKTVLNKTIETGTDDIDMSDFREGIYIVQIIGSRGITAEKILKF